MIEWLESEKGSSHVEFGAVGASCALADVTSIGWLQVEIRASGVICSTEIGCTGLVA